MADKAIQNLDPATSLQGDELFVVQQSAMAKKVTFQVITNMLANLFQGIGIIKDIQEDESKISADGLEHTFVITMNTVSYDVETGTTTVIEIPTTFEFVVKDGAGISTITGPTVSGRDKTYTINFDKTGKASVPFTVRDGNYVDTISETETPAQSSDGLTHTYTVHFIDSDATTGHEDQSFTLRDGNYVDTIRETQTPSQSSDNLTHTYTVHFVDSTAATGHPDQTFSVKDGRGVDSMSMVAGSGTEKDGKARYVDVTYSDKDGTGTHTTQQVGPIYDGLRGYRGVSINGITGPTPNQQNPLGKDYAIGFEAESGDSGAVVPGDFIFTVLDGSNIAHIEKVGTSGYLTDVYGIFLTSNTTYGTDNPVPDVTFNVSNGKSIASVAMISGSHAAGTSDTYRITFNDTDTFDFQIYNGANGTGAVSKVAGIEPNDAQGNVPLILKGSAPPTRATTGQENQMYLDTSAGMFYFCLGESNGIYIWQNIGNVFTGNGAPTQNTPGQVNQLYYDNNTGIIYMCTASDPDTPSYSWHGTGVIVDSALSSMSENPVQNKVIYETFQGLAGKYLSIESNQGTTASQKNNALKNLGITTGTTAQRNNLATFAGITLDLVGTVTLT